MDQKERYIDLIFDKVENFLVNGSGVDLQYTVGCPKKWKSFLNAHETFSRLITKKRCKIFLFTQTVRIDPSWQLSFNDSFFVVNFGRSPTTKL